MDLNKNFSILQSQCNELYKEYGATNEVMQLQLAINNLRNHFDVSDKTKMTTSNEGFVQ